MCFGERATVKSFLKLQNKTGGLEMITWGTFLPSGWVLYYWKDWQRDSLQSVNKDLHCSPVLDGNVMNKKFNSSCKTEDYLISPLTMLQSLNIVTGFYQLSPPAMSSAFWTSKYQLERLIELLYSQEEKKYPIKRGDQLRISTGQCKQNIKSMVPVGWLKGHFCHYSPCWPMLPFRSPVQEPVCLHILSWAKHSREDSFHTRLDLVH